MKIISTKKFEVFTISLREDGILHIHISDEDEYTVESMKNMTHIIGEMVNYKKIPFLITRDEAVLSSLETRNYWAQKDSCPYSIAEAFIIKTLAHKLTGNFYLNVIKPGRTTGTFNDEAEAVKWLKEFL